MTENPLQKAETAIDVGTGGGFPGLPLAILHPHVSFILLDSVGKKLTAVQNMAAQLELTNVEIHHGRAEDLVNRTFDVATGRSVTAIPQFCAFMHHLLNERTGSLLYWTGGDVSEDVLTKAASRDMIQELVPRVESDKFVLVFPVSSVATIAKESGIKVQRRSPGTITTTNRKPNNSKQKKSKGQWTQRNRNAPKNRGYDNFRRYNSVTSREDAEF